jgi:hypothetical protein
VVAESLVEGSDQRLAGATECVGEIDSPLTGLVAMC